MNDQENVIHDQSSSYIMAELQSAMSELAMMALADAEAMKKWNETMPGLCPGCIKPYGALITKGLCVKCRDRLTKLVKKKTVKY